MPTASFIDIDSLLQPISEDTPTGQDCREDASPMSPYQQIKGARNAARAAERNNLFGENDDDSAENWRTVLDLSPTLIAEQSKDLEVACWYAEAALRAHGIEGLNTSFKLIQGLVEVFWDNLYPMPDEDGIETRVAPLVGLNGEGADGVLSTPIRNTLICEGYSVGPFSYFQYAQVLEANRIQDEDQRATKLDNLGYTLTDVERAVAETPVDFYIDMLAHLEEAIEVYKAIGLKLDEYCGAYDAPPTKAIIELLSELETAVKHLSKDLMPVDMPEGETDESADDADGGQTTAGAGGFSATRNALANREQAFRQMEDIAEFFRKTEPHSPISYLLEKAVKWGNLPLADLMRELIPNEDSYDHFSMLTGAGKSNNHYDDE